MHFKGIITLLYVISEQFRPAYLSESIKFLCTVEESYCWMQVIAKLSVSTYLKIHRTIASTSDVLGLDRVLFHPFFNTVHVANMLCVCFLYENFVEVPWKVSFELTWASICYSKICCSVYCCWFTNILGIFLEQFFFKIFIHDAKILTQVIIIHSIFASLLMLKSYDFMRVDQLSTCISGKIIGVKFLNKPCLAWWFPGYICTHRNLSIFHFYIFVIWISHTYFFFDSFNNVSI